MVSVSFVHPQYLFFLFLIPLFIFIHLATLKNTRADALKFANFPAIARIRGIDFFSKNIILLVFSCVIIFLLVIAVSGTTLHITVKGSAESFVIAIDTSLSMEADDIIPNRLEAAKKAARDFVDYSPELTKLGVISFSGNALIEQSLTDAKSSLKTAINEVSLSSVGGTDLYEAIVTSSNLLQGENGKAIILLSDGQINVGDVKEAISYANENDLIVNAIAVGTADGGTTSYGISKVDEESLQAIAYNTDGKFFMVSSGDELEVVFREIVREEKTKVSVDLMRYSLLTSIVLFVLMYYLVNSRYRRWP